MYGTRNLSNKKINIESFSEYPCFFNYLHVVTILNTFLLINAFISIVLDQQTLPITAPLDATQDVSPLQQQ
jgi:hypothetical protein